ncbi:hypothetical protein BO78DRAFT_452009 [Aspergillus sclerotiicarbonarius CBS 121057]|uniref:Protein NO VEIN C-terminal domain-containing protein n=1 Tax=Aspergillus sclerotiicarbonarius (strain CBS 121057 / IBT 28362) TaxID=1448318 RepID=A0A319EQY2_ASPSB|nr:hypothetical protein BO78DRAFT_452009 [Aspergillus sclerotiicarbonarius CBS 121057]
MFGANGDRESARQLVKRIAKKHGYLDEGVLGAMSPEVRRQVEEALLKKDLMIGSSTPGDMLAKNLYNSSARFVFELLQNADDNSYARAKAMSVAPYISFHVHRRQIIVEYNEDGFTPENLIAICNVGKGSKLGAQGYIGEKGIGFKSVFMVAWKVHIQSGGFSFSFQHRIGDSGMGMISPVWEDTDEVLAVPLTRLTLFLHEDDSDEFLASQHETTLQQFRDIQATFLLFMRNLQRIDVHIHNDSDNSVLLTTFALEQQQGNRVQLRRKRVENGVSDESTQHYHIVREIASGLPRSENRTYSMAGLSTEAYSQAEVVLAFPLTHDSVPIVTSQDVFTFLPIRKMGFPFLIHSDFVTDASRQDVVRSSARNVRICRAIARVFTKAVSQFCEHPTLRYQWMRYLPSTQYYTHDHFWLPLVDQIRAWLKKIPTMWTKSHKNIRCVQHVRRVTPQLLDKGGEPLYPDVDVLDEKYLAAEYLPSDLALLTDYGLGWLTFRDFWDKVWQDLGRGDCSLMKSPTTDDDWHSRVARVLIEFWHRRPLGKGTVDLIPLVGGKWTTPDPRGGVIYPSVKGFTIPTDLNLHLVDPQAVQNPDRKEFFDLLGVQEPRVTVIRNNIIANNRGITFHSISPAQLKFLYLTAHLDRMNDVVSTYTGIKLLDHLQRDRAPGVDVLYYPDDQPYGARRLLQPAVSDQSQNIGPALKVLFLCDKYTDEFSAPTGERRTWKEWLKQMWQIRFGIPLTCQESLSPECLHIARHQPEMFLGFLVTYWKSDDAKISWNDKLKNDLRNLDVLCENGSMYPLGKPYIHTPQLEYVGTFLKEGEFFPWLKHGTSFNASQTAILDAMTKALGFGHPESDLEFHLIILRHVVNSNRDASKLQDVGRVYDLYSRVEARYHEAKSPFSSFNMMRAVFTSESLIYVPAYGRRDPCWTTLACCVWEGPPNLLSKYPLQSRYDQIGNSKYVDGLFRDTLAIPNASVNDFLRDLQQRKQHYGDCADLVDIYKLYIEIDKRRPEMDASLAEGVRWEFEQHALIYHKGASDARWYRPSQCLWSTGTEIKGMVALDGLYEQLPGFFIDLLGVRTLTLDMIHEKLVDQGRAQAAIGDIKDTIRLLNAYIQVAEVTSNPKQIRESKVLPVRYPNGTVGLISATIDFAIVDRKHLSDLFSGKAKLLDFRMNEIVQLQPFLRWLGLESRYLSSCTKEISMLSEQMHLPLSSPDRNISRKAHALLRIAVHFRSPRAVKDELSFYKLLQKIKVCETDGIRSELHLHQDGKDIAVQVSSSELHFHETEFGLAIYVPRDRKAQYLCFLDRVPSTLLEWLMTEPSTGICEPLSEKALNTIHLVLQAQDPYVALTLDRAGIVTVETPDDGANAGEDDGAWMATTEMQDTTERLGDQPSRDIPPSASETPVGSTHAQQLARSLTVSASVPDMLTYRGLTPRPTVDSLTALSHGIESTTQPVDSEYSRLLHSVVNAARRALFPSLGSFDMSAVADALDLQHPDADNEAFRLRTSEKIERDKKIGAAGELFVFEVLSRLSPILPGFSRDNWQSSIREYVRLHDEYADMQPWNGRETADITYSDSEGVLTSILIDKGYLRSDRWSGKTPKYYLEVKSTTSSCETPFYMSKYQYARVGLPFR